MSWRCLIVDRFQFPNDFWFHNIIVGVSKRRWQSFKCCGVVISQTEPILFLCFAILRQMRPRFRYAVARWFSGKYCDSMIRFQNWCFPTIAHQELLSGIGDISKIMQIRPNVTGLQPGCEKQNDGMNEMSDFRAVLVSKRSLKSQNRCCDKRTSLVIVQVISRIGFAMDNVIVCLFDLYQIWLEYNYFVGTLFCFGNFAIHYFDLRSIEFTS